MDFIDILDTLLKKNNVSKTQFAKDVGFSKNAYSEWKSGTTKSYMNKIDVIADYFGVSVDYLLGRDQSDDVSDEDLMYALFGGEGTEAQLEEVKKYAAFIKQRDKE